MKMLGFWGAALLVTSSCGTARFECLTSLTCPSGQACVHVGGGAEDEQYCAKVCQQDSDCASNLCRCPDSPPGSRCSVVGQTRAPTFLCFYEP